MVENLEQQSNRLFEEELRRMDAGADAMEKHLLNLPPDNPRRGEIVEAIELRRREIAYYKQVLAHWKR